MKRSLPILMGVVVVGVLFWVLTRAGQGPGPSVPAADEVEEQADLPILKAGAVEKRATPADPAIASRGPGRIEGQVFLAGEPAPARVEVRALRYNGSGQDSLLWPPYSDDPLLGQADAGPDGAFRIDGLALGSYEIHALSANGHTAWQRAYLRAGQPPLTVRLDLLGGDAFLQGRAVYTDDRPFRGFVWASLCFQSLRQVETDEQGRFRLDGLPEGTVALSFVVPEKLHVRFVNVPVPQDSGGLFVVDEGLLQLEGRVVADDDGTPLLAVRMSWDTGGADERRVIAAFETDADGAFTCLVPAHKGVIWARKEGFESLQYSYAEEKGLQLRLKRRGTITGRVVRKDTQEPLSGIEVHGWNWYTFDMKSPMAVTAEDGTFSGLAGPGKGMIYVFGAGWVLDSLTKATDQSQRVSIVEVGQGGTTEVLLEVIPTARVRGVVRGVGGKPAAGVQVQLRHPPQWSGFNHLFLHTDKSAVTTAEAGTYELEDLIPGFPYQVRATPTEGIPATSATFSVPSGESTTVDLQLVEGLPLVVRVVERGTGQGIEGVRVFGGQAGQRLSGTTDKDGAVALGTILLQPYTLSLMHPDYLASAGASGPFGRGSTFPAPLPGETQRVIELERGHRFRGTLLDPEGNPWTAGGGLGIHAVGARAGSDLGLTGRMTIPEVGTFDLGPVPAGTYDLILYEGRSSQLVTRWTVKTGQTDLALRIDPAQAEEEEKKQVVIKGTSADGQPVTGWLRVSPVDASYQDLKKMLVGTYPCDNARAGDVVWLHFFQMRSADGTEAGSTYQGPLTLKAGENPIQLPAPLSIRGHIRDADDKPLVGVALQLLPVVPESAPPIPNAFAMPGVRSKPDGSFEVDGLAAGPHRILVSAPPGYGMIAPPVVDAGQQDVSIQLAAAGAVTLQIRGPDDKPLAGARVIVSVPGTDASLVKRMVVSDDGGVAKVEGLSPDGKYLLQVDPPPPEGGIAAQWVSDWSPQDETVTLPRGRRIEGTLLQGEGAASPHEIWWMDSREQWQRVYSTQTGWFAITALHGSPVSIRVAPAQSASVAQGGPPTVVAADAPSVTIRLP